MTLTFENAFLVFMKPTLRHNKIKYTNFQTKKRTIYIVIKLHKILNIVKLCLLFVCKSYMFPCKTFKFEEYICTPCGQYVSDSSCSMKWCLFDFTLLARSFFFSAFQLSGESANFGNILKDSCVRETSQSFESVLIMKAP